MEDKSVKRRSRIVKVLLVVAGISFAVQIVTMGIGLSANSRWGPTGDIIFSTIYYSSMGLILAAGIGILIIVIAGRLKKGKEIPK